MTVRNNQIAPEYLKHLSDVTGEEKFIKRYKDFLYWINTFIEAAKAKGIYPLNARLMQEMNIEEMAHYLNYFYWSLINQFVRPHLKSLNNERINNYKIAACIEHTVMKYLPFEDENGNPIKELNADFAFHISLQILFAWNLEKENISPEKIKELLITNQPTKDFILEHKTWLKHHSIASPHVIFSNMQTMRLFHYWFREPKDGTFTSF